MNSSSMKTENRFTAGFKLLDKNQNQWAQIHSKTESNIAKSKLALKKLDSLDASCSRRLEAVDQFVDCYKSLHKLNEQIASINSDIKLLSSNFVQIENLLVVLRRHKEQDDCKKTMEKLRSECDLQVQKLVILSEMRRERLKQEHRQRVDAFEKEQEKELEERRILLEKAFEEEKSRYLEKTQSGVEK